MTQRNYTIRYYAHIESLDYRDEHGQLWLQCNSCGVPRIYWADTVKLPFSRREQILENLCDYFKAANEPAILVVDEHDKDRPELARLIARLAAEGQKLTIQSETAEQRDQFEEGWQLRWLRAGKKLKIEGTELATEEDYLRWKNAPKPASPSDGPATPKQRSRTAEEPPPAD